jgi:hypothetical protein
VAIILQSALHLAVGREAVMNRHYKDKCMQDNFCGDSCKNRVTVSRVWVMTPLMTLFEIHALRWWHEAQLCRPKGQMACLEDCLSLCPGCSHPAVGSHGVSRHLYFVERLEEPT